MAGLILTRPNTCGSGGGVSNTFETLILDSGTLTAVGADTLVIAGGNAIVTSGGGSPKTLTIAVDPSQIDLGDLGDVVVGGAVSGDVLGFDGANWVPVDPSAAALGITEGPGISIVSNGSPVTSVISLDICSLPVATGSPTTLDLTDTIAVCDGTTTYKYTLQDIADVLPIPPSAPSFGTVGADSGTAIATVPSDTLNIVGGTAVTTSVAGSPQTLTIAVDPTQINLGDLGDVTLGSPLSDGYTLVYRLGSPSGWVAEPSTTTDEYVKASNNDTTTGHLDAKLAAGTGIAFTTLNPSGNEQIEISANVGINDITDVTIVGSPAIPNEGDVLVYHAGSPGGWVNERPAPPPGNLQLVTINGQPTLVFEDTTRTTSGSPALNKLLSVAEQAISFSINDLDDLDWMQIGNAVDAASGYIADFDGTIVFATAHTADADGNSKGIDVYINGTNVATLGTLSGVGAQSFVNTALNIDFNRGDVIRLRGSSTGGKILDTVAKITLKWRGN